MNELNYCDFIKKQKKTIVGGRTFKRKIKNNPTRFRKKINYVNHFLYGLLKP